MSGTIVSEEDLKKCLRGTTVFSSGVFDILHTGHIHYLEQASKQADTVVVFVHSDASTKRMKGNNRPIQGEKERMAAIANLSFVNYVVLFDEESPFRVLKAFKPNVMARSGTPTGNKVKEFVEAYGGKAFYASILEGYSTTEIINNGKRLL